MKSAKAVCIIGLIVVLFSFTGCGHRSLLEEKMDAETIDKVQIVMFMGDYDRRDSKIIVDETEIEQLVDTFNTATRGKKVRIVDVVISGNSYYFFYSGDTLVQEVTFNGNDSERARIGDAVHYDDNVYYVEYQDKTPYELYNDSPAEVITVDRDFNIVE